MAEQATTEPAARRRSAQDRTSNQALAARVEQLERNEDLILDAIAGMSQAGKWTAAEIRGQREEAIA